LRGVAVGGPLHGQIISSSRDVEVNEQIWPLGTGFPRYYLDTSTEFRRGRYRAERIGVPGSSKTVTFWVHDAHSKEAAQAMAWEMLLDDFENGLHRNARKETRFP
jgi:hypothetical protein